MVVADQIVEGECLVVVDTVDAVVDCGYDSMLWRYIACTLEKTSLLLIRRKNRGWC